MAAARHTRTCASSAPQRLAHGHKTEVNRSTCGQTNSVGCMCFTAGMYGLYGYCLHVTCYEEIRDEFLSSNKDLGYVPVAMTLIWRFW
jgi:hypothetical protein